MEEGRVRIGRLSEREFLVAGVALYAGEGAKGDGRLRFVNWDSGMPVSADQYAIVAARSSPLVQVQPQAEPRLVDLVELP